jgi:hypothetical protein
MQQYYLGIGYNFLLADFYVLTMTIIFLVSSLYNIIR